MKHLLQLLTAMLWLIPSAFAQFDTATVLGTIRDKSGGVLAGAKVTLLSEATGYTESQQTNTNGNYEFLNVKIGTYDVTAEQTGFSSASAKDVLVNVNARQRVDLELTVGNLSQSIDVNGQAVLVESETSQRDQVVNTQQIVELPLNGRQYSSLILLTTGTRQSAIGTGGLTPREGSFNVNGLRSTFNNYLLDGLDNNAYGTSNQGFSNQVMQPSPDSVSQFQVVTNNMSAEYGRAGGATVNVASRGGTNDFHGTLYEFFRNTDLNATGFFKPSNNQTPPFHRNQFGGTAGGPIVKGKAFFFLDYEGLRLVRRFVQFATIPSLAQREGMVRSSAPIINPLTGKTYGPVDGQVQIPAADITPFAMKVLSGLPIPTNNSAANNFQTLEGFRDFTDKYGARFDYNANEKWTAFIRLGQRKVNQFQDPDIPGVSGNGGNGHIYALNQQLAAGTTYTLSPTQLIEGRFGVSRTQGGKNPIGLGTPLMQSYFGIPGLPTDPKIAGGLTTQQITGFTDLGRQATNPQWQYPTAFDPKINYSHVIGRHSLKAGYEYQWIDTEVEDVNPLYGRDQYAGSFSGSSLSDFYFGLRSQYALTNFFVAKLRQYMHFAYLQDDYKATSKLTLNIGMRYEFASPQWEANNRLSNFDPRTNTMLLAHSGDLYDRSLVNPDLGNWGPRFGFAYSPFQKTAVRGGYGISYVHFDRAGAANLLPINGPQVINAVVNQRPTDPNFLPTQAGYPAGLTDSSTFNPQAANVTYMPADSRATQVQSWFFDVQREVFKGAVFDIAYVGNRANRLLLFTDYNEAFPNAPSQNLSLQARRPISNFSDITYACHCGFSDYHSMQVRFEKRFSNGLFLLNSFTWSKAIDNTAGSLENPNGDVPSPQDARNFGGNKSVSSYDQPFTNVTSFVYQLPFGKGRRFLSDGPTVVDLLLGGWEMTGIVNFWSGQPINVYYQPVANLRLSGIQQDFRGQLQYRPNYVGGPVVTPEEQRGLTNYLNRAAFMVPSTTVPFGSAGRNIARSHSFRDVDLGIYKSFSLTERLGLQFRAEAFNLTNQTNFNPANSNFSTAAFGSITSTADPRLVQIALKLNF